MLFNYSQLQESKFEEEKIIAVKGVFRGKGGKGGTASPRYLWINNPKNIIALSALEKGYNEGKIGKKRGEIGEKKRKLEK